MTEAKPDNPYSLYFREIKVGKLLDALDAELGHAITEAEANALDLDTLQRAYERAAINTPSAKTIAALVERIRQRDQIRGAK